MSGLPYTYRRLVAARSGLQHGSSSPKSSSVGFPLSATIASGKGACLKCDEPTTETAMNEREAESAATAPAGATPAAATAAATAAVPASEKGPTPTLSRTGSTNSTNSELHRTLDCLNLNAPREVVRSVSISLPFRVPCSVSWLVGTWKGKGKGIFPTIRDFEYMEECSFEWDEKNPRPLLFYKQQTFSTKGYPPKPMHAESGYIRVIAISGSPVSKVEWIVTAPNGVSTIEEGTVEGYSIKLKLTSTIRSTTARPPYVTGLERTYTVDPTANPPTLHYTIDMATTKTPVMTRHLEAFLTKWSDDPASDVGEEGE